MMEEIYILLYETPDGCMYRKRKDFDEACNEAHYLIAGGWAITGEVELYKATRVEFNLVVNDKIIIKNNP